MGSRKELRKNARQSLKKHWFINVMIVFIAGLIINNGYHYRTADVMQQGVNGEITDEISDNYSASNVILEFLSEHNLNPFDLNPEETSEKYNSGVLSVFVNEYAQSRSFGFGILNGINKIAFQNKVKESILIFIMAVISMLFSMFIVSMIRVGENRYFLENRRYRYTKAEKLLFVYKVGRVRHVALVMFLRNLFNTLWSLTIVGGVIKHYEYLMIPYILAENPDAGRKEAFAISKEMMYGDKWNTFKLELSLIGWEILSLITGGILGVLFLNPYKECIYAELYMKLREKAVEKYSEVLNDDALAVEESYEWPYRMVDYKLPFVEKRKWLRIDYKRDYTVVTYILFFFSFSMVGWLWEVLLHIAETGTFVNRGTMFGPWLPIYGVGGLLILILLKPLREKPYLMFIGAFVVCGIVEYITAWGLETFAGMKWWDYTGYFMNIKGRICFEGLFVFGLAGVGFTYIFAPLLDSLYCLIKLKARKIICVVLLILFGIDVVYSVQHPNTGDGVTQKVEASADIETASELIM